MAITRISRAFKDISLSFKRHPVTNDIGVLKNADAIKRSVRNLVQTIPSERFFNSTLGSDVRDSLFENSPGFVDFGTASIIERQILSIIDAVPKSINPADVSNRVLLTSDPSKGLKNLSFGIVCTRFRTDLIIAFSFLSTPMSFVTGCLLKDRLISLNALDIRVIAIKR